MNEFDSTLSNMINLRMHGLHLRDFTVHRPSAGPEILAAHPRRWSKAIFILDGDGSSQIEAGTVVVLPPGQSHCRATATDRLPLCVVLDFRLDDRLRQKASVCTVQRTELLNAREQLAYLLRLQTEGGVHWAWEGTMVVMQLLVTMLRAAGWLRLAAPAPRPGSGPAMHRLLLSMPLASPLEQVVERSGYQRDHLNRLVKRETGLTLGQFRAQRRLDMAKDLLAQGVKVGDVAGEIGLPDQSYFARWFRRQTGVPPSQWTQVSTGQPGFDAALRCG